MADDKINKAMDTFNKVTVSMKNIVWLILLFLAVAFFYFQTDEHINNEDIHVSNKQIIKFGNTFQELRDRIEVLEWELNQHKNLTERRHKKQGILIKEIKSKL